MAADVWVQLITKTNLCNEKRLNIMKQMNSLFRSLFEYLLFFLFLIIYTSSKFRSQVNKETVIRIRSECWKYIYAYTPFAHLNWRELDYLVRENYVSKNLSAKNIIIIDFRTFRQSYLLFKTAKNRWNIRRRNRE